MPDSWQDLRPVHRAMQTLACNHLNIPGACKQGFSPLRQNQRTPSDMHAMSNTKGDSCGLRTQLAAWQTNLQCTRLTVHQHTCADTTANSTHTHTHTHTHTQCCTSSALGKHHYRSRWCLHLNLDRSRIVFSISATASSTCSACRSTLNVLLTSAFLQRAPQTLNS